MERYARFEPEIIADPYPLFDQLRAEAPIHWSPAFNSWLITTHADVVSSSRDLRLSAARASYFMSQLPEPVREAVLPLERQMSTFLAFTDPPDHTRIRGLVNKAFEPKRMLPRVQEIVDSLLDEVQDDGRMDLISDFAVPLPAIVIAEVVGMPPEDRLRFKRWGDDVAGFVGGSSIPDRALAAQRSLLEMNDYIDGMVALRRLEPRDDFLSALIAGREEGKIVNEELVSLISTFLVAGHETTTNLIGNGMLALLRHPDQMRKLKTDPSLIASAVEELLRFDSPLQRTDRVAAEEMEIGGNLIGKGQFVKLMLGAANRDPAQFPQPHRLDIARQNNRHVAFGYGIHFCVGAPLARIEGQLAINSILRRLPKLRLEADAALEYSPNLGLRALKSLPVSF